MSRLLAILLGLVLFAALTIFCVARESPRIAEELTLRASGALQSSEIDWAEASVDGRLVTLTGFAPSTEERMRAVSVVSDVGGVRSVRDGLETRPAVFEFQARRDGPSIVLTGNVPDERSRSTVLARAASLFGAEVVVDDLVVSGPAPDGAWVAMARRGLDLLVKLDSGKVSLRNQDVSLSGVAASRQEQERIGAELMEELPAGYTSSIDISVPEPVALTADDCAAEFANLMSGKQITFETDSARLTPESGPILNEVVSLAQRCDGVRIEVVGHTDSLGDADRNRDLSQQRAVAVAVYIRGRGVDSRRVVSIGLGEAQPIATNRTRRGRALNRRIEFKVQPE